MVLVQKEAFGSSVGTGKATQSTGEVAESAS